MGYLIQSECERIAKVRSLLEKKNMDLALVHYDEFNIGKCRGSNSKFRNSYRWRIGYDRTSPKVNGYAGVMGNALPVSCRYLEKQKERMKYLREAFYEITENGAVSFSPRMDKLHARGI